MSPAIPLLWLHLVVLVFLVGYATFWTVALAPARGGIEPAAPALLLRLRYPPFGPLRVPLALVGWIGLAAAGASGFALAGAADAPVGAAKMVAFGLAAGLHGWLLARPRVWLAAALLAALLAAAALAVALPLSYRGVLLALHLLAMLLWLGHMFFWSFVVGPLCKRWPERAEGDALRAASHRFGALGGPALLVLFATGSALLVARGGVPGVFPWKLALVGGMVVYQVLVGHRRAPLLVQLNMLAALVVLWLSALLVHGA